MSIVNMKKMHLLGLKTERDMLLDAIYKMGAVEISDITPQVQENEVQQNRFGQELEKELSELDSKLNRLKFGIDFLKPYVTEKNPLLYGKPKVKRQELDDMLSGEEQYMAVIQAVFELDHRLARLKAEESKIRSRMELLSLWKAMDIPLEELGPTLETEFMPAAVPIKALEDFKGRLAEKGLLFEALKIGESRDEAFCLLVCHKAQKADVQDAMKEFSVSMQEFPGLKGTPEEIIAGDERRLAEIEKERQNIAGEARALSDQRFAFEVLYDYWNMVREKKRNMLKMVETSRTFCMTAWIPESLAEKLKQRIGELTDSVYIEFSSPEEDDDIPVLVENPRLVQPFELITELYSLPDPRGIDPNIYMAPFYFVFFGMMVSDAGYGLVLALLTGLALWKLKLAGQGKKLVELLFLGGISTFVWGAIFGGWFGDLIKLKPLWINPLDNPMAILVLSFAFGVIQIYTGLLLSAYKNIRAGRLADAFMDQGLWIVFLSGLIMLAFPQLGSISKYVALGGALGLLLTQGRAQKNILMKFLSGLLSLYGVTGYLSDVLSYSRLLALGLATGVIAVVINTMARLVGVNAIGFIIMVLIMIGGHIFNIAINTLGAYVHSSRLQYIEFFSKFYDSGGRAFEPMRIKTTYVDFENL
ncbi:MAG: V-type ATP synthase subunit I [Tepidanaerobacteraceae bacterium]|jgi:V/A-type H+-transporting ATPase subunit I|nr:V-type ATP synthase subunit I [Tepidanaerobacteraceae bacterium]